MVSLVLDKPAKHKTFLIQDLEKKEFYTVSEYAEKLGVSFEALRKKLNKAFRNEVRPDIRVDVSHPAFFEATTVRKGGKAKGLLYVLPDNTVEYSFEAPEKWTLAVNLKTRTVQMPDGKTVAIAWEKGIFPAKKS